jgi:tetratricopeptide (TPR) repeat protein
MEPGHPSLETLAKWLAGRLEHDEVRGEIVPHLAERCAGCRARFAEIGRLQGEVGHWDEVVAVLEGQAAPGVVAELLALPAPARWRRAAEIADWGASHELLRRSRETAPDDPAAAADQALLAVVMSEQLSSAYDPNWVLDLQARAHAQLADARRRLGERHGAGEELRRAEECLARSTTGSPLVLADVLTARAALCRDEGQPEEASQLLDEALALYRQTEERDAATVAEAVLAIVESADLQADLGDFESAVAKVVEAESLASGLAPSASLRIELKVLDVLTRAGRAEQAAVRLARARALVATEGGELEGALLGWIEARLALAAGETPAAESGLRRVWPSLARQRRCGDAALAVLELALLLLHDDGTAAEERLKSLAAELTQALAAGAAETATASNRSAHAEKDRNAATAGAKLGPKKRRALRRTGEPQ